ncbi:hypothetical protein CPC16_011980 [Podila verticillata]|nr:hypothetical protein BGZ59_007311 [Podila verticillata]KAF9377100.1 hypothetical protein CPC16_011980 [Podila verticillata]KFH71482.1 hypothetical protein MVEG_01781 [Podila verticillata NRRL 6337]
MPGEKIEKCFPRQELTDRAKVDFVESTPIRFYIRTAQQVFKQARIYHNEGDLQTCYILYMRYANLVITELKRHPEFNAPENKASIAALKKDALVAMNEIGYLNPILDKKYDDYKEHLRKRAEKQQLAQAREASLQSEASRQQERLAKDQERFWANNQPAQDWSLFKALEGVPGVNTTQPHHQHHHHQHHQEIQEFQYPEHVQRQHQSQWATPTPTIRQQPLIPTPTGTPPALPRKPVTNNAPKLPPKIFEDDVHEFSQGLRTMTVPLRLLDRFLNIVRPNTIKKLETCGILAGVLSRNKFTVTTLIIPKQTATSDTCSTTNEDELFEFQMERDLMTLGWIHTHPTQTCFMSSVDLHTHCSYQLMLPEAIAIVCAPSHEKDYGVFRLTDPPGLQVITQCRQKPLFHQHPGENDIYTDACDQGHVELVDLDLDIVDLRSK